MEIPESGQKKRKDFRWLLVLAALLLLGTVVGYLLTAEDNIDISYTEEAPSLQLVSVETAVVGAESGEVRSYAEVRPRWTAELKAAVAGKVTNVLENALSGERVAKGSALIRIEDSRYVANLVAAELTLEQAKLALRKAKVKTAVARKEYEHTGARPLNDLALHLPELQIAENQVQAAETKVIVAGKDLNNTIISAPFSAFVTERYVSPGQSVSEGDRLIKLADDSVFELMTELGRNDWLLVKQPLVGTSIRL